VIRRAYTHGVGSFSYPGGDQLGQVTYSRESGCYAVHISEPIAASPLAEAASEAQALNEPIEVQER
jgi:hypothetical protein